MWSCKIEWISKLSRNVKEPKKIQVINSRFLVAEKWNEILKISKIRCNRFVLTGSAGDRTEKFIPKMLKHRKMIGFRYFH